MFFFRWEESLEGIYVNREKVKKLPFELEPGDWWFIEDGDVYAAVRPLKSTHLKGNCKTVLEKRLHHIVLYQDNANAEDITGISDEEWLQSQGGFVVEMGDQAEYGSFRNFRETILKSKVVTDESNAFQRHIIYSRDNKEMEMIWDCWMEEYSLRKINGIEEEWTRYAESPEFVVSDKGMLKTADAELITAVGNSVWLLSAMNSRTWVAYQSQFGKELPLELRCPVGKIYTDKYPFGKLIMHEKGDRVVVEIDAGYEFLNGEQIKGKADPYELVLEIPAEKVSCIINGKEYEPDREVINGKSIFRVNPYSKPEELETTMLSRPVRKY